MVKRCTCNAAELGPCLVHLTVCEQATPKPLFTAEDLKFTHDDFDELKSPYTVPLVRHIVDRCNAKVAPLQAELERLRNDVLKQNYSERLLLAEQERDRLREALEMIAKAKYLGGSVPNEINEIARAALAGKDEK